jgi:hypothetical protein
LPKTFFYYKLAIRVAALAWLFYARALRRLKSLGELCYNLPDRPGLEYLQQIQPVERIAYSYHVYRIEPLPADPQAPIQEPMQEPIQEPIQEPMQE